MRCILGYTSGEKRQSLFGAPCSLLVPAGARERRALGRPWRRLVWCGHKAHLFWLFYHQNRAHNSGMPANDMRSLTLEPDSSPWSPFSLLTPQSSTRSAIAALPCWHTPDFLPEFALHSAVLHRDFIRPGRRIRLCDGRPGIINAFLTS